MALKRPIVLGGSDDLHVPLAGGDTLDPSSISVDADKTSLLVNNAVSGLGAFLHTKNSTSFTFTGAGSVESPLTLAPIISPAAGNQLNVLPSGLFAAGLLDAPVVNYIDKPSGTVITPTFSKKYQSENIYLVGVDGGDYTLDVSKMFISVSGLSPAYRVRIEARSRGSSTVTLKGKSYTPDGSYTADQKLTLGADFVVYDICIRLGSAPFVIKVWPQA